MNTHTSGPCWPRNLAVLLDVWKPQDQPFPAIALGLIRQDSLFMVSTVDLPLFFRVEGQAGLANHTVWIGDNTTQGRFCWNGTISGILAGSTQVNGQAGNLLREAGAQGLI